ncbi:hypothetical protein [Streptoalloteichus hindustanus]|uniref:Uncharacterized protein n=1 Tax=Streptoalloteichus hindustanus TaxID=2017 RepID=A0A1M5D2U7_STRHI|nr:hypothetical protein [Streptoalloteichus hindustanus]SHF61319.1 hypothetical protein SAMN05444320_104277 [Streptoalloteichus hindustanus]
MTLSTTNASTRKARRPNLERQALLFTIGLYLFICAALLAVHYAAPAPASPPAKENKSSSGSPFNP